MSFTQKMKALNLTSYELERRIVAREKQARGLLQEIKTLKSLKRIALERESMNGAAHAAAQ